MSLFNSVLGSLSPKLNDSFEDPHARDHELSRYRSQSPRIPPPIASSVLWSAPPASLSPPPRVPDNLLVLQRKARHLEQQLQELLDAQSDGLMSGPGVPDGIPDDLISNGSTTPTVSSVRDAGGSTGSEEHVQGTRRKKVGLNAARKGISKRIQQLASVKAEELDLLDDNMRDLQVIVKKTDTWTQKRSRLEKKIKAMETEGNGANAQTLQNEKSKLEEEIRQKEEELWALKRRHRQIQNQLADTENSVEAKLSSYKASLSIMDKDIASFLARPPKTNHQALSTSPFLSLPAKRRTLEMAHDYWTDEQNRLAEKCEEVDINRAALDEGVVLWNDVVKRVVNFEANLQSHMQHAARDGNSDPTKLLEEMDATITYLEEKVEFASERSWTLLVCAIGAEFEAFKEGKDLLEEALGVSRKGKEKAVERLVDTENTHMENDGEEVSRSAIRIGRASPPKSTAPRPQPKLFDTDDEDPDPELMISHHDTDTD
jgi:hypothetical protein